MNLTLLNCAILTNDGYYAMNTVPLSVVQTMVRDASTINSAIGHASTAQILTTLLGIEVPLNRQQYRQQVHDVAIVFSLNQRLDEGKILSVEEINRIGYTFKTLVREV